jgi:hypothetical protein
MPIASEMFSSRCEVLGRWVAVMEHRRNDRKLVPAAWKTRCICAGEIHEFILCQHGRTHGEEINDVSYLGFAEITSGGVVALGDGLHVDGRLIGTVCGFDETHAPNHYNILIATERLVTGAEIGLVVGESVIFRPELGRPARCENPQSVHRN